MIEKATRFATKAHEGQLRKGTTRPYIVHPLEVAQIVSTITNDEEVIVAALLHDTVEDCEEVTVQIIREEFGPRVAAIVAQESEDKSKSWMARKGYTIYSLINAKKEVQMVALGDKLSNMRDIDRDYPEEGEAFWNRFRMNNKQVIAWYYKGVESSLRDNLGHTEAFEEYSQLIRKNFG